MISPPNAQTELLKRTRGRCLDCGLPCPAEVHKAGEKIFLHRSCPEHGESSSLISSDARFYWLAKGKEANSCCGGGCDGSLGKNADGRGEEPFETLSTCLALIEIVDSCNLSCPTCYADSPSGVGARLKYHPLAELQARIEGVIARKGPIEILQLSGGEPTLHPQFFELLAWTQAHPQIDFVLLNTNGVRLAREPKFVAELGTLAAKGGLQLYLQFDGTELAGQAELRGADLRTLKNDALKACGDIDLTVTLAMTVIAENIDQLWKTVSFGLTHAHVRGISFQPQFGSGRLENEGHRLNTADIILAAVEQSEGTLKFEDFTPLPCGDPNCATIGYLLKLGEAVHSVSDFIDFSEVQGFLRDKMNYDLADLANCGCDSEPLGELLKQFELDESNTFRLFIKPFMDAHSWDEDRIDRCCTHVIRPDGELDSFCRYYSGFPDTQPAP